jgi:hypothetical protein
VDTIKELLEIAKDLIQIVVLVLTVLKLINKTDNDEK